MASVSLVRQAGSGAGAALLACVGEHGSAAHPWFGSEPLVSGPDSARNLADAVHLLCALHGRQPGLVDLAAARTVEPEARAWLNAGAGAMTAERNYLTRLAVAAGPVPGTPGGAASEAGVAAQRGALATLAQSDRRGCALGAALAFAADWIPIRALLDTAARRLGLEPPPSRLGREEELRAVADAAADSPSAERALLFGAQQLALQHRALWDLLEARREARSGA
ncbi:MAG TPA: hypothetical protein VF704_08930 [Allosphingosinicella sp.]|jgi:hypothetical protein